MATAASTTAVNVTFIFANYEKKVILATTLASSGADLKTQLLANWPEGSIFDTERWICRCCSANAEMIARSISISDEKIIFITNYLLSGCCSWAIFSIQQFFFSFLTWSLWLQDLLLPALLFEHKRLLFLNCSRFELKNIKTTDTLHRLLDDLLSYRLDYLW